ncbi:MAG TPA: alpha/beta hydrolase [Bryobacteraceae bacterium]|nr:alpha/beta hydrolase [Bryobacteraceae bacterium]
MPQESAVAVNGVTLTIFEWPGAEPAILLCHATGFHARCWDQVVAQLGDRRAIAVDMRGHGRSSKPAPPYAWKHFGQDIAGLTRELNLKGAVGVGHSMGGHSIARAAALNPHAFSRLTLIDPVIRPRENYIGPWVGSGFVAKRRNQWSSPEEMYDRFRDRAPFLYWNPAVLHDYCQYGLLPMENGGFQLACPPEIEANIYENSTVPSSMIYDEMAAIDIPVRVVRSGKHANKQFADSFDASPTAKDLAAHFRHGTDLELGGFSHFIPMETPELTAQMILACGAGQGAKKNENR